MDFKDIGSNKSAFNASNTDDEELIQLYGRLEAFGPMGQTIMVLLYSLVTFLAFTGNTLVILVELYGKRSARNLQKFLINLAISDILIGVLCVPFTYTHFMLVCTFIECQLVAQMSTWFTSRVDGYSTLFSAQLLNLFKWCLCVSPHTRSPSLVLKGNFKLVASVEKHLKVPFGQFSLGKAFCHMGCSSIQTKQFISIKSKPYVH